MSLFIYFIGHPILDSDSALQRNDKILSSTQLAHVGGQKVCAKTAAPTYSWFLFITMDGIMSSGRPARPGTIVPWTSTSSESCIFGGYLEFLEAIIDHLLLYWSPKGKLSLYTDAK